MKKYFYIASCCCIIITVCVIIGLALLFAVHLIPTNSIINHVAESIPVFEKEGDYPFIFEWCFSQLDNWTDATILKNAAYDGDESLLDRVLLVYRYNGDLNNAPLSSAESLISYYSNDSAVEFYPVSYPRYWHGYLTIIKPLLVIMNYQGIRILNTVIQAFLVVLTTFLLWKKHLKHIIIPWLIAWGLLVPSAIGASLQFSSIFYIVVISNITLLCLYNKWRYLHSVIYFFLIVGCTTSYFDFLTYPIATLGMPLILYFCLYNPETTKSGLKRILVFSIAWGMGYIGMWAAKWVLSSLLTEQNVIANALETILLRTSHKTVAGMDFSFAEMYILHLKGFCKNPAMLFAISYCLICLLHAIHQKQYRRNNIVFWGLIAVMPFAWYFVTGNHSYVHWWFTCKGLVVTAFSVMCYFSCINNGGVHEQHHHFRGRACEQRRTSHDADFDLRIEEAFPRPQNLSFGMEHKQSRA